METKYKVTVFGKNNKILTTYNNQTRKQVLDIEDKRLKEPEVVLIKSDPE